MSIPRFIPRHGHELVSDLLCILNKRFAPLQWPTNNATGISIHVARTVYITFIRSIIDFYSPLLIQFPSTSLKPLETFQNRILRTILGCPITINVSHMQAELRIPSITTRIMTTMSCLTSKCLFFPFRVPHFTRLLKKTIAGDSCTTHLHPGGRRLLCTMATAYLSLNLPLPLPDTHSLRLLGCYLFRRWCIHLLPLTLSQHSKNNWL